MKTETAPMRVRDIMAHDVVTVGEGDELVAALQIMVWRKVRHLPVLRDGKLVGLLSERDVLSHGGAAESQSPVTGKVADAMQSPVETIAPSALVADAAARMALRKIGCLPVVEDGSLIGIVTRTDVLLTVAMTPVERRSSADELRVETVMTTRIVATRPEDDLLEAVALMVQHGVRHLPVVDGLRRIVGILSERDVHRALGDPASAFEQGHLSRRIATMKVRDAMTANPRTVRPHTRCAEIAQILIDERLGALPVSDDEDHLVGIVSYIDLLKRWTDRPDAAGAPSAR